MYPEDKELQGEGIPKTTQVAKSPGSGGGVDTKAVDFSTSEVREPDSSLEIAGTGGGVDTKGPEEVVS